MDALPPQNQNNTPSQKTDLKKNRLEEALRREKRKKFFWIGGITVFVLGVIALIGYYATRPQDPLPGVAYPELSRDHVALDHQDTYNSNPPTSGPHYSSPANWGVYDYEVNDRFFIHNLEHGGIWISYRPVSATSSPDAHVAEHLKAIVDEFGASKIVMAPRTANDADIAIAAWTRVLKINLMGGDITEEQLNEIRAFYRAWKNRGPEFVPDSMPGVDPKTIQ